MKYFVLIPDGMADRPLSKFGNKTPMEVACKPCMDYLCKKSYCGTVSNVPEGMVPESDTANLAILSYNPKIYSKGRSPLEAVSMGIDMKENDTAIRCNLVTLSEDIDDYFEKTMIDHSSDEITTEEANELVKALNDAMPEKGRMLHTGVSYRHCLIWEGADDKYPFMRPHDILRQKIKEHLPSVENGGEAFLEYMVESYKVLKDHPVNVERRKAGLRPANSAWLWSPGKKPMLPKFEDKWGLKGAIISAVDLIKGIGLCAGMEVVNVEGATGNYSTNYVGKANAAIDCFKKGSDFVYVHVEAPDECGHRGEDTVKVKAVEKIDSLILKPVSDYLNGTNEPFKIMVLPDHPTPIEIRTHSMESVPFFIFDSEKETKGAEMFSEKDAASMNNYVPDGSNLLSIMFGKSN